MEKKKRTKKPDLNSKVGKYFLAVQAGETKQEAQRIAGFKSDTNSASIEKRESFKAIQTYFKDEMMQQSSMQELAGELLKVVRQDKELGAKTSAIKLALDKIEPTGSNNIDIEADKVMVVLRS